MMFCARARRNSLVWVVIDIEAAGGSLTWCQRDRTHERNRVPFLRADVAMGGYWKGAGSGGGDLKPAGEKFSRAILTVSGVPRWRHHPLNG